MSAKNIKDIISAKNIIRLIDENNKEELKKTYIELSEDNHKVNLDYLFYALKKYIYNPEETLNETIEERLKRQDSNYRKEIIEKYNTCMITGKSLKYSQVAHIYPYSLSDENEKYDLENGFLLSVEIHIGFDSKELDFKINPDTSTFEVSSHILNDRFMEYYHQFNNKKLNLSEKNIYYLKKKYNYINHI